jgi:outer membrane receptor protein involved in Fe transport
VATASACVVLSSTSVWSQAAATDPATLAKYDLNRNGVLDPSEVAAKDADDAQAAQTPVATTPAGTPGASGAAVVQMSPFTVETDDESGYYASNTLSGTRLNSKIEDLASSITVVTKQQMQDMAALDINDIFLYEANTEGTGNYTSFSVGRGGDVNDAIQSDPATANRVRGIASANTARGNYATNSSIPIDPYNIDAVEISRGPNSNIFGLGNASGTVNVIPARANVTRDISQVTARVDSYGGHRGSIDLNRPIIDGKLAVRASAVFENKGFERKPSKETTRRQQVMFTAQPFKNTTLRGSFENISQFARRPNSLTPRDTVTYWESAGRPTWDPITFTAKVIGTAVGVFPQNQDNNLPLGLRSQGTGFYNRPSMFIDDGGVQYWSVNRTTSGSNANSPNTNVRFLESGTDIMRLRDSRFPLFTTPGISNQALYDWEEINYIAPNYSQLNAKVFNVELEQFILNTPRHLLAVQLGWFQEDTKRYSRNFINGNSAVLNVDINERLLDGSPNPYFLRPYLGASEPTAFQTPQLNDIYRGQIAYQLDLTRSRNKWVAALGQHRVSAYAEDRKITSGTFRYWEIVLSDHSWLNTANRANSAAAARSYTRYYLGDDSGQNIDYAPPALYDLAGTYDFNWLNGSTGQWITEQAQFGEAARSAAGRNQRHIRTKGVVTQNYFWGDRIVTTFGWRNDNQRSRDSFGPVVDPTTGLVDFAPMDEWRDWTEGEGDTKTKGVVVKPFDWLSFHYNESDSFVPASTQYTLFGDQLPNPTGTGEDYGLSLRLFDDKLVLRLNKYENFQKNARGGDGGIIATRANRMDFGNDGHNLEDWAREVVTLRLQNQGIAQPTEEQLIPGVTALMGVPDGWVTNIQGKSISSTSDVKGEGYELEVSYNPTRFWTMKLTGARQESIDDNLSPDIARYIEERMPVWTTVRDDEGELWWTSTNAQNFFNGVVNTPFRLAIANQGKPKSQVREWRANFLTNVRLAGFTNHHWFRNMAVGGSVRWESRASIGFLGDPDSDGVIRELNPDKPVYDSARSYVDFHMSYSTRLFDDRVRARFQLNVRNAFEGGRLQAIGVNPDGSPYNFRIIDPRQIILSTTFDF